MTTHEFDMGNLRNIFDIFIMVIKKEFTYFEVKIKNLELIPFLLYLTFDVFWISYDIVLMSKV